jgi:hypothetical protein
MERDMHTNLDELRELYRLLCCVLEIVDGENLEAGLIDLWSDG